MASIAKFQAQKEKREEGLTFTKQYRRPRTNPFYFASKFKIISESRVNLTKLFIFLILAGSTSPLWAVPATVENLDYKVTLSETLPGLDDQVVPQMGPTITVTIQDKFHSTGMVYPLSVYAINDYALSGDYLNLLCRVTSKISDGGPRYTFIQLNLSSPSDSRQFQPLKSFSFSPGNQYLLATFDGNGQPDPIGLIQLDGSAKLGWLYSNKSMINLFQKALPAMVQGIVMNNPIGWSGDSSTAVFVASAGDGTQDAQGKMVQKDYLTRLELDGDDFKLAAEPIDLSPYHYRDGSIISDVKCSADKATLFFSQSNSSDILQADFPLPALAH